MISDSRFSPGHGPCRCRARWRVEGVFAFFFVQAQLMLGALGQAVVAQLQLAHVHVFLMQAIHAQQRVQVLGVHAQLLQLAILIGDDLREELVQAHKALQVLLNRSS
jgi:hypothetical protein